MPLIEYEITSDTDRVSFIHKIDGQVYFSDYFAKREALVTTEAENVVITFKKTRQIVPISKLTIPNVTDIKDAFDKIRAIVFD